jgi:hypothetical protein
MADDFPEELRLRDPLNEVTRKERRFLLGLSLISILVAKTGLMPTKISALGIECTRADQNTILWVMILLVLYTLVAFVIYGIPDFMLWRSSKRLVHKQDFLENETLKELIGTAVQDATKKKCEENKMVTAEWVSELREELSKQFMPIAVAMYNPRSLSRVSWARAVFDFLLPIPIGIYAAYCLWTSFGCYPN